MSKLGKLLYSPGEFWRDFFLKRYPEPLDEMILRSGSVGRCSKPSAPESEDPIPEAYPVHFPIDVVYTWVNGDDPAWLVKKRAVLARTGASAAASTPARFACRGELKYSLRSIESYAPWVNRIHIVTDRQVPTWLDASSDKVRVVDHTEIIPPEYLPTFNSHVIESYLHRIPGLSERYIYFNDDVMLARPMGPEHFYAANGNAHLFITRAETPEGPTARSDNPTQAAAKNVRELLRRRFGQYMRYSFAHTFHPQLRSVNERIAQEFAPEIASSSHNRFRHRSDIAFATYLAPNYTYLIGRADLRTTLCAYFRVRSPLAVRFYGELLARAGTARAPESMCLNDIDVTGASVELLLKHELDFLERYFPEPSRFERGPHPHAPSSDASSPGQVGSTPRLRVVA